MWLIVGLGNPGSKYEKTKHNIGFFTIDRMASGLTFKSEHKALVAKSKIGDTPVLLVKPQTFMNLSGQSVVSIAQFYKIPPDRLVVVHDEVDQVFGQIKVQKNRGPGGHNGVKSVSELMGTADYYRIRLGVGRPHTPMQVVDWVLTGFSQEEWQKMPEYIETSQKAVETLVLKGFGDAATQFNKKPSDPKPKTEPSSVLEKKKD